LENLNDSGKHLRASRAVLPPPAGILAHMGRRSFLSRLDGSGARTGFHGALPRDAQQAATLVRLDANQTLFTEGEERRSFFILTSGMLRALATLLDGRRQITDFILPGDLLCLADEDVYSHCAEAVIPSELIAVPTRDMDRAVQQHPGLARKMHAMTRGALRKARERQVLLGCLTASEKVASFLLLMSRHAIACGLPGNLLYLPMTRSDIADYLGLTVETVSRALTGLKKQGLIRLAAPQVIDLVDEGGLIRIAALPSVTRGMERPPAVTPC
jgi:cAMP-binding proteins - catabolite gene activator and regulatory subunit of cAMP-dependent protein kinases